MSGLGHRRPTRGGCLLKLLGLLGFLGALAILTWMLFLPGVLTGALSRRTGFDVETASLALNPATGRLVVRGLSITNPPTFPVRDGLRVTLLEADADVGSYFGSIFVLDQLTIEVGRATLVKRQDGRTNWEVFQQNLAGPVPLPPSAKSRILVKRFRIKFDVLVLADHSSGRPIVREHRVNFDETFTNVSDPKQLMVPSVLRSLVASDAAGELTGFLSGEVADVLKRSLQAGETWLKTSVERAGAGFRALDRLEEMRKP